MPSNWFAPTLLADVTLDMRVLHEETFRPVLPVMRVADAEEALRRTNDSPLGLSGSIWSRDAQRANPLARRIESGSVCVNDVLFNYLCVEVPLGGVKQSGLGRRHGEDALRQFCRVETVMEDARVLGRISGWLARRIGFPYDMRVLGIARRAMRWLYCTNDASRDTDCDLSALSGTETTCPPASCGATSQHRTRHKHGLP